MSHFKPLHIERRAIQGVPILGENLFGGFLSPPSSPFLTLINNPIKGSKF